MVMSSGVAWAAVVVPCALLGLALGVTLELLQRRRRRPGKKADAKKHNDLEAGSTLSVDMFEGLHSEQPEEEPTALRSLNETANVGPHLPADTQILAEQNMAVPYISPDTGRPEYETTGPQQPMPYVTRVTALPYIDANTTVPYITEVTKDPSPMAGQEEPAKLSSEQIATKSSNGSDITPPVSPRFVNGMEDTLRMKLERQQFKEQSGKEALEVPRSRSNVASIQVIDEQLAERFAQQQQKERSHESAVEAARTPREVDASREPELAKSVVQSSLAVDVASMLAAKQRSGVVTPTAPCTPRGAKLAMVQGGLAVDLAAKLARQQQKERDGAATPTTPRTPRGADLAKFGMDPELAARLERQRQKESADAAVA